MENILKNKKNFLIQSSILISISYILGIITKLGSEISYLSIIYSFLIFMCCFYYKFQKPSGKPINAWIISSSFAFLLGSATTDIYKHELLIVPSICLLIFGISIKFNKSISSRFNWFSPENESAYNYYQIVLPLLTVLGLVLLGLTAIFMIQTNSVYTLFSHILFALNLFVMAVTFIMSLMILYFNNTNKSVYTSMYISVFTLYGILISHYYFIK